MAAEITSAWLRKLREHIDGGGQVRDGSSVELYHGRCGGVVLRQNGSDTDLTRFCNRAAGWGTDHSRIGYCRFHEDQLGSTDALPPWTGDLEDEDWRLLTGGRERPGRPGEGIQILGKVKASWDDFIRQALTPEEYQVFLTMPNDPVVILDHEIKLNRLQAMRIHRQLQQLNMAAEMSPHHVGGGSVSLEVNQLQAKLVAISGVLARLMEVRHRFSELAQGDRNQEWLEQALSELPMEDFGTLSSDPRRLLRLMNRSGSVEA